MIHSSVCGPITLGPKTSTLERKDKARTTDLFLTKVRNSTWQRARISVSKSPREEGSNGEEMDGSRNIRLSEVSIDSR